jgi:Asp-tRNA(Asn)/Glu-tRNA(Gln) amidotransferase A subunit family amidase
MAKNETRPVNPSQLSANEDTFAALQTIEGYAPNNPAYTLAAITTAHNTLITSQQAAVQAEAAAATARDEAVAEAWRFHNTILAVKDQVRAQFGKDSAQVQALGLKRKSEYKSPQRKPNTGNKPPSS